MSYKKNKCKVSYEKFKIFWIEAVESLSLQCEVIHGEGTNHELAVKSSRHVH